MQKKSSQLLAPAILKAASLVKISIIFSASNQRSAPHFFRLQSQIGLGINHVFVLILSNVQWRSLNHHINYLNETPPNHNKHHPGHSVHSYKRGFQTSPRWQNGPGYICRPGKVDLIIIIVIISIYVMVYHSFRHHTVWLYCDEVKGLDFVLTDNDHLLQLFKISSSPFLPIFPAIWLIFITIQ